MKHHYHCDLKWLDTGPQVIRYRLYRNSYHPRPRRLLLLHGAGVAGQDTWEHLITYLSHWSEVLVPDLRGMGETRFPDAVERPFCVEEVMDDVRQLLDHLGWWKLDLGGYSFGGLVAMLLKQVHPARIGRQFLLESALLDRASVAEVIALRERYADAAEMMRVKDTAEAGIRSFLDTISPNRTLNPRAEAMTIARLAQRPEGFAYALDAVSAAARTLDRKRLLEAQGPVSSFVGGRSVTALLDYQQQLARTQANWQVHIVAGTDHSLPFQKPRQIARLMNSDLADELQPARSESGHPETLS